VDKELAMHLYEQLFIESDFRVRGPEYVHDIVDDGLKHFQDSGKQKFSSPTDSLEIKIGGRRMNYPNLRITKGVMDIQRCGRVTLLRRVCRRYFDFV
jgi:hypothetical protein